MSLKTQSKVLRALEEQRFEPVGSEATINVDARVIAATNKKLEEEIEAGRFRADLFYRLNVIPFEIPPLRERLEDVPLLVEHFRREFSVANGRPPKEFKPSAIERMQSYSWPGNVRELRNTVERVIIMHARTQISSSCTHARRLKPMTCPSWAPKCRPHPVTISIHIARPLKLTNANTSCANWPKLKATSRALLN
jgi:DNA-binding NtrC family response regulator